VKGVAGWRFADSRGRPPGGRSGVTNRSGCELQYSHISWLARDLGANRQNVQRIVNDLQKEGLVAFEANPHHRRAQLVVLTDKGKQTFDAAMRLQTPWINGLSDGLSIEDIERLAESWPCYGEARRRRRRRGAGLTLVAHRPASPRRGRNGGAPCFKPGAGPMAAARTRRAYCAERELGAAISETAERGGQRCNDPDLILGAHQLRVAFRTLLWKPL
jgi:DNA-binding MarR family transcriptional regulator